jgi:hypothetical protein
MVRLLVEKLDEPSLRRFEVGNVLASDERVMIAEYNVGAPSVEQLDQISVHLGAQKCHGVPGPEGAYIDLFREETDKRRLNGERW